MLSVEHMGSAHTDDELAMLLQVAEERRHAGQLALDLGDVGADGAGTAAVVKGTASLIWWEVLASIYGDMGLDRLGDGKLALAPGDRAGKSPMSSKRTSSGPGTTWPTAR